MAVMTRVSEPASMDASPLQPQDPRCQQIVLSFLDFLRSVEPSQRPDADSLEVAFQCLCEAFHLDLNDDILRTQLAPVPLAPLFSYFHSLISVPGFQAQSAPGRGSQPLDLSGLTIGEDTAMGMGGAGPGLHQAPVVPAGTSVVLPTARAEAPLAAAATGVTQPVESVAVEHAELLHLLREVSGEQSEAALTAEEKAMVGQQRQLYEQTVGRYEQGLTHADLETYRAALERHLASLPRLLPVPFTAMRPGSDRQLPEKSGLSDADVAVNAASTSGAATSLSSAEAEGAEEAGSSSTDSTSPPQTAQEALQSPAVQTKRNEYFASLHSQGYFFGTSPNSAEFSQRHAQAAKRFDDAIQAQYEDTPGGLVTGLAEEAEREGAVTAQAEDLKRQGNIAICSKQYQAAVDLYSQAIALCPTNAIYFSNRAAAFHHLTLYFAAISDCVRSIQLDPNFWRPFSRLGHAYMALGRFQEAAQFGFLRALQLDPTNAGLEESLERFSRLAGQKKRRQKERRKMTANRKWEEANRRMQRESLEHHGRAAPSHPPNPPCHAHVPPGTSRAGGDQTAGTSRARDQPAGAPPQPPPSTQGTPGGGPSLDELPPQLIQMARDTGILSAQGADFMKNLLQRVPAQEGGVGGGGRGGGSSDGGGIPVLATSGRGGREGRISWNALVWTEEVEGGMLDGCVVFRNMC